MITAKSILAAVDARREELALATGGELLSYVKVGDQIELHSALFTRLKNGHIPGEETIQKLAAWVGGEEKLHCSTCDELAEDLEEEVDEDATENGETEAEPEKEELVQAVYAVGKLSTSEDPETQADINRAKELLREGAVGVSVALDLHPDDATVFADAEKAAEEDGWEKTFNDYLPEGFVPRNRIRHTAIVGTPAFADARLKLDEDGVTVRGIVTFQGEFTGDLRKTDLVDLASSRVPSPILYNRGQEGHEGPTIGYLESFEWVERPPSSHRTVLDDEAITASVKPLTLPARYFAQTVPTKGQPLTVGEADENGFRAISGLAAPTGVCHRSSMACFTFPKDPDPELRHFHTGSLIGLDDGRDIRVGALTMGGSHIDPALAKHGVTAREVGNHRDDANKVVALVRAFQTRFGLWVNGVIPPDVTKGQLLRLLASSCSVELWPIGRGKRTLIGIHAVPTPAWPVMASAGSAEIAVMDEPIVLGEDVEDLSEELAAEPETDVELDMTKIDALHEEIHALHQKIDSLAEVAKATLALIPVEDLEIE